MTSLKAVVASRLAMNCSMSSTVSAATVIVTVIVPSRATLGRSDVMRTLSGSVFSRRFSKSVHENSRWPMMVFASRAASEIESSSLAFTAWRVRTARARSSVARVSAALASPLSDDWRRVSRTICVRLKIVSTTTISAVTASTPWTPRSL